MYFYTISIHTIATETVGLVAWKATEIHRKQEEMDKRKKVSSVYENRWIEEKKTGGIFLKKRLPDRF